MSQTWFWLHFYCQGLIAGVLIVVLYSVTLALTRRMERRVLSEVAPIVAKRSVNLAGFLSEI